MGPFCGMRLLELGLTHDDVRAFESAFTDAAWAVEKGMGSTLAAALADWSSRTWFTVPGDAESRVCHLTGMRPGHSTADLVFN